MENKPNPNGLTGGRPIVDEPAAWVKYYNLGYFKV